MNCQRVAFWMRVFLCNIAIFAALLFAAEFIYRISHSNEKLHVRTFPGEHSNQGANWVRLSPEFGWVFNKDLFGAGPHHRNGHRWSPTINKEGFRSTIDFDRIGKKGLTGRVLVLGDSMTFGPNLNDSETLPAFLQKELGLEYEVYNLSSQGWGLDQMYLAYMEYVDKIDPCIVLIVYIDDDILRTFESYRRIEGLNKPSFTVESGRLKSRAGTKPGALEWIASRSFIANIVYNGWYKPRESIRISKALFSELVRQTRLRAQKIIVLRYPYKFEMKKDVSKDLEFDLKVFFDSSEITFLDPQRVMSSSCGDSDTSSYLGDDYPASAGNEFIAAYIAKNSNLKCEPFKFKGQTG